MKTPHKIFSDSIDPKAIDQFYDALKQDFSVKGALMPDAHFGYTMPIGGVIAAEGVVVPSWVGYDIGCGVCALPTTFNADEVRKVAPLISKVVYNMIPTGKNRHKNGTSSSLNPGSLSSTGYAAYIKRGGFSHLGTLGGGNHFIEIGVDESNEVWIIIHSGSRGLGHGIAGSWMAIASDSPKPKEGHYALDITSDKGCEYINDLNWCLDFALENRRRMMEKVTEAIRSFCEGSGRWPMLINRNHNHAEPKGGLWIHRKGATHAEKGMMGVIPGNMRDGSFIVEGLGNEESLCSSSHGAGRVLGRNQAKKTLSLKDFSDTMEGVVARVSKSTLDESPMAYKDIFEVMKLQKDLVKIHHHVKPILNLKG